MQSSLNKGELNELLLKIFLVNLRDNFPKQETIFGKIKSVGLDNEYNTLNFEIDFEEIDTQISNNNFELIYSISKTLGITKSSSSYKADVIINDNPISLKFSGAARPALVNHTNRLGWLRISDEINFNISILDEIIDSYWNLRDQSIIGEDIININTNSPFADNLEILRPIINYFAFDGTGSKKSNLPAELIMDFNNFRNTDTWSFYDRNNFLDNVWNKLVFSIRSKKGMPPDYNNYKFRDDISPWTRKIDGKYKGALHIRISK
jgi:hypothetical protein